MDPASLVACVRCGNRHLLGHAASEPAGHARPTVTASDGSLAVSDTFKLTIAPVNDAPVLTSLIADQTVSEETAWSFRVPAGTFADADSSLTYTATLANGSALPSWLSFDAATQTFSGTPPQNYTGPIDLKVIASDGALTASDTFTLTVTPVNDAPVVSAPILDQAVAPGTNWSFQVPTGAFSDVDRDGLTYTAALADGTALPSWVTFDATTGTFSGMPPLSQTGSLDFKVTASDGSFTVSDTFTLMIKPVARVPSPKVPMTTSSRRATATTGFMAASAMTRCRARAATTQSMAARITAGSCVTSPPAS